MGTTLVERSTGDVIPAADHNDVKDYIEDGTTRVNALSFNVQGLGEVIDSSGIWTGALIPVAKGGTGIAYFTAAGPTTARTYTFPDAAATILYSGGDAGTPSALVGTNISALPVAGLADGTDGELITWAADATATTVAAGDDGQVLTSNGAGAAPTFQANDVITWSGEAGTPVALVVNHGYINQNAGLTTFTLPATAALGTIIKIVGEGAGGWTISQNAAQNVQYSSMSTTVGAGGFISSTDRYDVVYIVCRVADTTWSVVNAIGVLDVI